MTKKLKTNNWFRIYLSEGKNREIRKIFENFNLVVNRIIRTNYGEYSINKMRSGEFKKVNAIHPDSHSASAKDGPADNACSLEIL